MRQIQLVEWFDVVKRKRQAAGGRMIAGEYLAKGLGFMQNWPVEPMVDRDPDPTFLDDFQASPESKNGKGILNRRMILFCRRQEIAIPKKNKANLAEAVRKWIKEQEE